MENQIFDYIVVGAGSAGSVLANRLSVNPGHRVLVLEAGRESHPWSRIPVGFARLINNPAANWLYSSEPDEGTGQRRIPIPRGKLLGGSSSINGMVFVRGQSQDYDQWAQLGNRGWSYREVLPIFRDMESYQGDADDEYRGRNGPLKVTESNETGPLYQALIKAAGEVGIAYTKDYNGAKQDGIGMTQATIRKGRRMSTAFCYLDPARGRPNLTIQVVPYSAGGHTGLLGAFTIADLAGLPGTVNVEDITYGRVFEDPATVSRVTLHYKSLQSEALPKGASRELIARVAEERWKASAPLTGASRAIRETAAGSASRSVPPPR